MKTYIERAAALDICQKEYEDRLRMADYCGDTVAWNIGGAIKSLPAADVVEVVRCGECRHAEDSLVLWCHEHEKAVSRLDFCSHGARMDKEDEDGQDPIKRSASDH